MSLVRLSRGLSRLYRMQPIQRFCTMPPSDQSKVNRQTTGESESEEPTAEPMDELTQLYDAVLAQVPRHGWADKAITEAVQELGWSVAANRMIARGPVQVAEEFVNRCNKRLALQLAKEADKDEVGPEGAGDVRKAVFAIRERIAMVEPFHESWARALALQALPQNSPRALKASAMLADEIAHFAGYRKPNVSWYTDRAVIAFAYHSAELYWLTDQSDGREDTWRFLERRFSDSHDLRFRAGSVYNNLLALSDATVGSLSTLIRSTRRSY